MRPGLEGEEIPHSAPIQLSERVLRPYLAGAVHWYMRLEILMAPLSIAISCDMS